MWMIRDHKKFGLSAIAAATALVFIGDLLTPLGVVLWVLYVPLCLIGLWLGGRRAALFLAGLCSGLIVAGLLLSPPGVPFGWAVANRMVGLCVLWLALWASDSIRRELGRLSDAAQEAQFLNLVLEHLPGMVFIKNAVDLRFVAFNKGGEELLGYTHEELIGKTDYDFFPKSEADFFTEKDRVVLASGRVLDIGEETILTRDKGVRVLRTKKVPIRDGLGVPRYLLGFSEDITEWKTKGEKDALRLRQLKRLAELSVMMSGEPHEVFERIVHTLGELFAVRVVYLSEIVGQELVFKAVSVNGRVLRDAGGCSLAITPCATVEHTKDVRIFDRVMERFPQASFLKDHEAFAYCGVPALDSAGRVAAVICLLDDKPHEFSEEDQTLLRVFGQRIAVEIERDRHLAEHKRVEEALRQQKSQLKALVNSLDDIVFEFDEHGIYRNVWTGNGQLLAKPKAEVLGRTIVDALGEETGRPFMDIVARVAASGKREDVEYSLDVPGGQRWFFARTSSIEGLSGAPKTVSMFIRDISERKRAERELAKSHAMLRSIVDNFPHHVFWKDRESRYLGCNPLCAQAAGVASPHDIVGKTDYELIWGASADLYRADDCVVMETKTPKLSFEEPLCLPDGSQRWLRTSKVPLLDVDGAVYGILGVFEDITDRKRMEAALRESERRLCDAQQLARLGNWELELPSNRLHWSDEIFRIFQVDKAMFDLSYEASLNAIHPDDRARVHDIYMASVRSHAPYDIVCRLLMPDGSIKYVEVRGETLYDAEGQPHRSIGTVQDVTEQRLGELRTERALQEKEMLLREVHHRVKNNLQMVSSLLYFQSKKIRNDEDLRMIREVQDRIKSMILVHEKLYQSGNLARVEFDEYVRALVDGICHSYERLRGKVEVLVQAQPVTLPMEFALPAGLVVNELLTNAFKYAFPDRGGEVRVRVANYDGGVEITVEDTGVGLPAGFDSQTSATFGYQLMRGLVVQLGGTMTCDGVGGTAVKLVIPLSGA